MGGAGPLTRRGFGRRLFGYKKGEVDAYVITAAATNESLQTEVDRLRAAEPLTRTSEEVARLVVSFAESVASMQDSAAQDAARTRREAELHAEAQRAEADRLVLDAIDRARVAAGDVLSRARAEFAVFAEQGRAVERALEEASRGITVALDAVRQLEQLPHALVAGPGADPPVTPGPGDHGESETGTEGESMLCTPSPET